jgi:hypothetical protein
VQLVLQQLAVSGTQQPRHLHQPGGCLLTQNGHDVCSIWPVAELPQGGEYRHVGFASAAVLHTLPPGNTHRMLRRCLCRKHGDHGRFTNACLARHQDHAPLSLHDLGQAGVELAQHRFSFNEESTRPWRTEASGLPPQGGQGRKRRP